MKLRFHTYLLLIVCFLAMISCNDKLTCPAYTSYFVLENSSAPLVASASRGDFPDPSYLLRENDIRDQYFSYMGEDSMPRTDRQAARMDQFGIAHKPGFFGKKNDLKMILMEVVIPESSDSIKFGGDIELLAELENVDSVAMDSAALGVRYKYNLDQKYYLWYLRDKLVWKDELEKQQAEPTSATKVSDDDKAPKQGFFKRTFGGLFKKKDKSSDPDEETPVEEAKEDEEEEDPEGF